jgi:photosystem II stability/assembly factor-like uncharacterized protein
VHVVATAAGRGLPYKVAGTYPVKVPATFWTIGRLEAPLSWTTGIAATIAAVSAYVAADWTPQASGVTTRLRGVSAVSARVAWASGATGTVLRTVNGGTNWQQLAVPDAATLDFRDIDAVNDRTAFVLSIGPGEASRIYRTTDAGATWDLQFTNLDPRAFFDAMAFWDAHRGVAFSDSIDGRFVVLITRDGGRTWTRVPPEALPPALENEGAFAASGTNVAVHGPDLVWIGTGAAARSRVLRSADGGQTWSIADTPLASGPSSGIFSIAFRDAMHGIVVGGDYRKESEAADNVAVTSDGGVTWTLAGRPGSAIRGPGSERPGAGGLSGFRSVVAPVPGAARSWIAVGPSGADISTDDGHSWTRIEGPGFHTFSFAPGLAVGWGAGEKGSIAKFTW